jgi:hypothetical protein
LQDREPLLDLIHPRAVDQGGAQTEPRVLGEPGANLFAVVRAEVVAEHVYLENP